MSQTKDLRTLAMAAESASVVVVVIILYAARDVCIPLALGMLIAFLLTPLVNRLQRLGLSNTVAVLMTALCVFCCLTLLALMAWSNLSDMVGELPRYKKEIGTKIGALQQYTRNWGSITSIAQDLAGTEKVEPAASAETTEKSGFEEAKQEAEETGKSAANPMYVQQVRSNDVTLRDWAGSVGIVFGPLGTSGLVTVFVLFLLLYRDDLRDRFVAVISRGKYVVTTEALDEASARISKYLMAQLILNVSFGLTFYVGLVLIGLFMTPEGVFPNAVLLGVFAGLVRFIPYLGPLIGAGLPITVAFALLPGYGAVVGVTLLIVGMELISNNIVEPWVYGTSTGVSSIAVIMSAVFWGWLWGPVGLLLATPLTSCLVVLGRYVHRFRFFATLLSDEQQIKPSIRLYQRLLSGDKLKINQLIAAEKKDRSVEQFLDEVIIPTLKRFINHRQLDDVSDIELTSRMMTSLDESGLIQSETSKQEENTESPNKNRLEIVGIAARNAAEAMILKVLSASLTETTSIEVVETVDLPDRIASEIAAQSPDAVIVMALPGQRFRQAAFWCESLRASGYSHSIHVVIPGRYKSFDRILLRFRKAGATSVLTSVQQASRRLQAEGERKVRQLSSV